MKLLTINNALSLKRGDIVCYSFGKNADGTCKRYRVNGAVKIWKRSGFFRVPLKRGLYEYSCIDPSNFANYHEHGSCPNCQ